MPSDDRLRRVKELAKLIKREKDPHEFVSLSREMIGLINEHLATSRKPPQGVTLHTLKASKDR